MIEHLFVFAASVMIAETTTKRTASNINNSIDYVTYYSKILANISRKKKMMMMYV